MEGREKGREGGGIKGEIDITTDRRIEKQRVSEREREKIQAEKKEKKEKVEER